MGRAYQQVTEIGPGGWSDWIAPAESYRMACCSCGLVHDLQFQAVPVLADHGNGLWTPGEAIDRDKVRVLFRARRNNRATGQVRRHNKRRKA
jgi:hypothetical protein